MRLRDGGGGKGERGEGGRGNKGGEGCYRGMEGGYGEDVGAMWGDVEELG